MISNRVKRNISGTLMVLAIILVIARAWNVILEPASGKTWFELCAMLLAVYICFDNFSIYRRRVNAGIKFGSH